MKRAITIALLCSVAVALPAASGIADPGNGDSGEHSKAEVAKQCAALKKADKPAFKALFGKHAMRDCIKGGAAVTPEELVNAAQECRAEREADPVVFQETWGTNSPGGEKSHGAKRNAFGKCVSSKVREDGDDEEAPATG